MFDAKIRPYIDPPLNALGRRLANLGVSANALTFTGLAIGLSGAMAIASEHYVIGLLLILANRLCDGLDGAVARVVGPTSLGGYCDIVADFAFYVSIPLGFGIANADNTQAAMVLVSSFVLTGTSFLAFAVIAAERREQTTAHGQKSFFYSTGIAEGTETVVALSLMALFPGWFVPLAYGFAALCLLTVFQRSAIAVTQFRD